MTSKDLRDRTDAASLRRAFWTSGEDDGGATSSVLTALWSRRVAELRFAFISALRRRPLPGACTGLSSTSSNMAAEVRDRTGDCMLACAGGVPNSSASWSRDRVATEPALLELRNAWLDEPSRPELWLFAASGDSCPPDSLDLSGKSYASLVAKCADLRPVLRLGCEPVELKLSSRFRFLADVSDVPREGLVGSAGSSKPPRSRLNESSPTLTRLGS